VLPGRGHSRAGLWAGFSGGRRRDLRSRSELVFDLLGHPMGACQLLSSLFEISRTDLIAAAPMTTAASPHQPNRSLDGEDECTDERHLDRAHADGVAAGRWPVGSP
jgi:hypothetical protein